MVYQLPRLFSKPSLPRAFAVPGGRVPFGETTLASPEPFADTRETDENGLPLALYPNLSPLGRYYLSRTYEELKLDKSIPPIQHQFGPIPEAVFFGGLLVRGFAYRGYSTRSFEFQTMLLGGRDIPGGSVADFIIHLGTRTIAVYTSSIFHIPENPFGGAAKVEEDKRLQERLVARAGIDALVVANSPSRGFPLEHGPDDMLLLEFELAIHA